jgi:hypothetical protein
MLNNKKPRLFLILYPSYLQGADLGGADLGGTDLGGTDEKKEEKQKL